MENHIGNMIRNRVAEMPDMTSKILAEKMGVHEQTIYDIYKRASINTDILLKISKILGVPVTYFLAGPEQSNGEVSEPKFEPTAELANAAKTNDLFSAGETKLKSKSPVSYSYQNAELPYNYSSATSSALEKENYTKSAKNNATKETIEATNEAIDASSTSSNWSTSSPNAATNYNAASIPSHVQFPQQVPPPLSNISHSIREIKDMQYKQELEHALEKLKLLEKQMADKELIIQLLLEKVKALQGTEY
jgi:plasmid maintenance system antidote protein VapI